MWAARCAWPSKPTLQVGSEGAEWGDALVMAMACLNALLDPGSAAVEADVREVNEASDRVQLRASEVFDEALALTI